MAHDDQSVPKWAASSQNAGFAWFAASAVLGFNSWNVSGFCIIGYTSSWLQCIIGTQIYGSGEADIPTMTSDWVIADI